VNAIPDPPSQPPLLMPVDEQELSNRIIRGDRQALAALFAHYRPRLWRIVNFRLNPQLQGRIDADDVLQDAWIHAVDRITYFLRDASHSPFIWFRLIVNQTIVELERRHLGAEKRSASRERSFEAKFSPAATSSALAFHLSGSVTSPSQAVGRTELARQIDVALSGLSEIDREIIALRHFEELSNTETARVLNVTEQAASARYVRALKRLKQVLQAIPEFTDTPSVPLRPRPGEANS